MSDLILYTSDDGESRLQLRVDGGTIWLSQLEIAELFQTTKHNVSIHTKNLFEEGELSEEATVKQSLTVRKEGNREVKRSISLFNLDLILAIGYRVRSPRGTQFRQWATANLREYLVKGFVMDDQRLADPGGWDYFDELLARIRDIRASEKRFDQKVRDLFGLSSPDRDDMFKPRTPVRGLGRSILSQSRQGRQTFARAGYLSFLSGLIGGGGRADHGLASVASACRP